MIRQFLIRRKAGPKSIRWRQHAPTRMEGFTDSVFAFAVTLIVVSLEVPATYKELIGSMRGFLGFAICFALIMLIWFEQYQFFRKYGLQDVKTIFLNSVLLFLVLFFVYPLKFLFGFLTQGNQVMLKSGDYGMRFTSGNEISELMMVYSGGYIVIYFVFWLLYRHALNRKDELLLSEPEIYNTRTAMIGYLAMIGIGVLSFILAFAGTYTGGLFSFFAGISYGLIGPALGIIYNRRLKKLKQRFSAEEIERLSTEEIVLETRKNT